MKIPQGYKQTEVGIIPEDWSIMQLGDIGTFSKGSGISKDESNSGNIPCIRYGEIYTIHDFYIKKYHSFISEDIAKQSKLLKYGDILFAASGETKEDIGKCVAFLSDCKAYAGGDIIILSPKVHSFDSKYLGYILNTSEIAKQKASKGQGDAIVHITTETLSNLIVPIPPTIEEQRRIAEVLSDVDGLITALDKKIAKKKLIKQASMQQLLTGKKRLKEFSDEWHAITLGELADIYQPATISQEDFTIDGYDVYGANGIIGKFSQYNHTTDQILITCRGSSCGSVNYSTGRCWITGNAMVINMDNCKIADKQFVYYDLLNCDLSELITGSGQPQIVRSPLQEYELCIPLNMEEQQAIATILSDMDKEISDLERKRDKYKLLKNGMMQKLLTGQIRIK